MSLRCRPVSIESVSSDRQSFLSGRKTYYGNARNTNTGLSVPLTSEESSIYNAARAGSVDDRYSLTRSTDNPMDEILDSGIAANMAMFIPLAHEAHALYLSKEQMIKCPTRDSHPLSDNCVAATARCDEKSALVLSDVSLRKHSHDKSRHRKVASLNDVDDVQRVPRWPGRKASPVRPAIPRFSPPYRSPTPPGLPSFGSPEAISYSTQFFVRSFVREGHIQQRAPPTTGTLISNGGGVASCGKTLRRLFGISSPAPPRPTRQPIPVARAEDGTAVLGRFPYRHSAHGTSLVRRLDDHTFHRRALPAADCETVEEERDANRPNGYGTSVTPAIPKPAVTGRSRNTRLATVSRAKILIPRQTSISQAQHGRTSLSGNAPQQQSSDRIGETRQSLDMTGTVHGSADPLLHFLQNRTLSLCCCLPGFGEQDDIIYSQSSNDTYTTARSSPTNGIDCRV